MIDCETMTVTPDTKERRFEELVHVHRVGAVRLAWRLLGTHHGAAEDVAQQAFMRAWKGFDTFRNEAQLRTWFNRILVNQVRSYLRWVGVREKAARIFLRDAKVTPALADHGLQKRIMSAMDKLSGGQREAFTLVYLEGLSMAEAAECLGRSTGTVKSHLFRAHQRLRMELGDLKENRP